MGIVAATLQQYLDKDPTIRVSDDWDALNLSADQIRYAATDAYASLAVYQALMAIPVPGNLPEVPPLGLPISVLDDGGNKVVAHGVVAHQPQSVNGIKVTKTRLAVTVLEVLIETSITVVRDQVITTAKTPFDIVCRRTRLQTHPTQPTTLVPPNSSFLAVPQSELSEAGHLSGLSFLETLDDAPDADDSESSGVHIEQDANLPYDGTEDDPATAIVNADSVTQGKAVTAELDAETWNPVIRARVLKDVFHFMHGIPISRTHGLRKPFARDLRDAIFLLDEDDKARITIQLAKSGITFDRQMRYNAKWVLARCKRVIPPPEQLYPAVKKVFDTYGPLQDAKTGLPLFNNACWHAVKNALKVVRNGQLSDPPGIPLYYVVALDHKENNLPIYRCIRGTNFVEGGVHQNIRRRLPIAGASPRHTVTRLTDYVLKHNLLVRASLKYRRWS